MYVESWYKDPNPFIRALPGILACLALQASSRQRAPGTAWRTATCSSLCGGAPSTHP